MSFFEHLEELRWRLIKALASVVLFSILAFTFSDQIIDWLIRPTRHLTIPMSLQVLKVQGLLMLKFTVAFVLGVGLSLPAIAYQLWAFVAPGLFREERRWGPLIICAVTLFFLIGAAFAYWVIIPFALNFMVNIGVEGIARNISIEFYTRFVLQLLLATGIIFQMPVLTFLLARLGLVTPQFLRRYWRVAVVIILIIAAIITPPDPVSMIIMSIPLLALYVFSIGIAHLAVRKRTRLPITEEASRP